MHLGLRGRKEIPSNRSFKGGEVQWTMVSVIDWTEGGLLGCFIPHLDMNIDQKK